MSALEIFQLIADGMTATAAVLAVTIAGMGLKTWQRAMHGKTEHELARKLLLGVYRVRDAVDSFRAPLVHAWEMVPDGAQPQLLPPANGQAVALTRRWERVAEAYSVLQVDLLEGEVMWRDKLVAPHSDLVDCLQKLRSSADWLAELEQSQDAKTEAKEKAELRRTVFRLHDSDTFGSRFTATVDSFTAALREYVTR